MFSTIFLSIQITSINLFISYALVGGNLLAIHAKYHPPINPTMIATPNACTNILIV